MHINIYTTVCYLNFSLIVDWTSCSGWREWESLCWSGKSTPRHVWTCDKNHDDKWFKVCCVVSSIFLSFLFFYFFIFNYSYCSNINMEFVQNIGYAMLFPAKCWRLSILFKADSAWTICIKGFNSFPTGQWWSTSGPSN